MSFRGIIYVKLSKIMKIKPITVVIIFFNQEFYYFTPVFRKLLKKIPLGSLNEYTI